MKCTHFFFSILLIACSCFSKQVFAQESFKFHKVHAGETAFSISKLYGISLEDFYKFNPETRRELKAGDVVMVPVMSRPKEESIDSSAFHIHIVQEGQTLYSIGRQYEVPTDLIEIHNPDIKNQIIHPGMRLLIPKHPKRSPLPNSTSVPDSPAPDGFHLVKPGESLFSIARLYDLSLPDILALNPLQDSVIRPGQLLRVRPADEKKPSQGENNLTGKSADTTRFTMHRVEAGETIASLARKYSLSVEDILQYNPELRQMSLKAGMLLLIPLSIPTGTELPPSDPIPGIPEFPDEKSVKFAEYFNLIGKRKLKIALILPVSSDAPNRDLRPVDIVGMDYYLGVKTALETLQKQGYQFTLQVVELPEYSTEFSQTRSRVVNCDLIIGPFVPQQAKVFTETLHSRDKVPVVVPFGTPNLSSVGSVWMQETEDQEVRELASTILSEYPDLPMYIIYSDAKGAKANQLNDLFRKYLGNKTVKEVHLTGGLQGLSSVTETPESKVIVFFHDDDFLSQQFIERIRRQRISNILVLNRKILDNPLIEPRYLNQLNLLIASPRHIHYEHPLVVAASESIASQYKLETNDIILYAFQSTYDLVRALTDPQHRTEFIKIKSTRKKGVFQNEAVQILTIRNYKLVPLNAISTQNQ
ncbi:MAG: LysM peptidoglycan-binding domain-containing protein [Thermaurantimonas sp.]